MYNRFRKQTLISLVAIALITPSGAVFAAAVSQDVVEARQETQIWTTYALSPYLRAGNLKVVVKNGKATLTGNVEEDVNKDLAGQIALGVNGIKEIDNQIVVQADYKPAKKDRDYGDVIDDASITSAVKSRLLWSKYSNNSTTKVTTQLGKVVLSGTTHDAASKDFAGRLTMNTRGVMAVNNQLVINSKEPGLDTGAKRGAHETGQVIADSWITTKVKSTYLYSSNVSGSAITVNTTKGIVSLTGKVASGAEKALAIELAQNTRGVSSVNSKDLSF